MLDKLHMTLLLISESLSNRFNDNEKRNINAFFEF